VSEGSAISNSKHNYSISRQAISNISGLLIKLNIAVLFVTNNYDNSLVVKLPVRIQIILGGLPFIKVIS
jgi:hypothetical protein